MLSNLLVVKIKQLPFYLANPIKVYNQTMTHVCTYDTGIWNSFIP